MPPAIPESKLLGGKAEFSLQEAYLAFNVRESYLQRHANPVASGYEAIIQTTDEFETKTTSIYKTKDLSVHPV